MLKSKFEQDFQAHVPVSFEQEINYFLGICFHNKCDKEGHVEIKMTQTAYIDNLCQHNNLSDNSINTPKSTYCSDYPINLVLSEEYDEITQKRYTTQLQTICWIIKLVECFNLP